MVSYDVIMKSNVIHPRSDSRNWPRSSECFSQLLCIHASSNLQVTRTAIKSRTSSNFGRICQVILELCAHERWNKWYPQLFSVTYNWIFVKIAGNEDRHKSSNEFEFGPDRIIHFGVICPWAQNLFPHRLIMEKLCLQVFKHPLFKHLLHRNWANQSQISYGASMGRGNETVCSNSPGHMTKVAAIPIYGKKLKKKIFFSGTKRPMTLKLGIQHRVLEYYLVCSNDDPGLTLTYFYGKVKFGPLCFCMWKRLNNGFSETIVVYDLKLATDDRIDKKFLLTSKLCPLGLCAPCRGGICMY